MYFNQRGDKYGQIIHIGIGGWGRLKEAQTVGTETRLTVKENSPESAEKVSFGVVSLRKLFYLELSYFSYCYYYLWLLCSSFLSPDTDEDLFPFSFLHNS